MHRFISFLSHLCAANRWHALSAQMARIPSVMIILIIDIIVLAVAAIVVLVLPGEASLNSLVHRGAFQSLLLLLSLRTVAQLLIHELLMHLVTWTLALSSHHVAIWSSCAIGLVCTHFKVVLPADGWVGAVIVR